MVFRNSTVGLLALTLGIVNLSNGLAHPRNDDNSEQSNTPRISPEDIFAFINRKEQSNTQVSRQQLMNASYEYLQRKIRASQNDTEISKNILGLATLLQNHPNRNFPQMDSVGSARHVIALLKRIIEGGVHDKNNHYARVHYGELLLRRIKNGMSEEEKLFGGKVLSKVDKRFTQVGTLYLVELILDHNFLPEGVSTNQIGQHCVDLLKSTYSHKKPRTESESRAVTLLTDTAQAQAQSSSSTTAQPTAADQTPSDSNAQPDSPQLSAPAPTLPELNTQPDNLHKSDFQKLREQLERKAVALKASEETALREQGVETIANLNPSVANAEQERPEEQNPGNVNAADPLVGQKRGRTDDDIDALLDDSLFDGEADKAPFFDNSDAENEDGSVKSERSNTTWQDANEEGSDEGDPLDKFNQSVNPFFTEEELRRIDAMHPDSDMGGPRRTSSSTDTEMRNATDPKNAKMNGRDPDDDSSRTTSSEDSDSDDDDSSSTSSSDHADSDDDSSNTSSSDDDSSSANRSSIRRNAPKYTDEQIQTIAKVIEKEPFQNNEKWRKIIWDILTKEQLDYFGDSKSSKFKSHVTSKWPKILSNNNIKFNRKQVFYYTDELMQSIVGAIRPGPFKNDKKGRKIIWNLLTKEQKAFFPKGYTSNKFLRNVSLTLLKKLSDCGIRVEKAVVFLRHIEPYTDIQINNVVTAIGTGPFKNDEKGRKIIWDALTQKQRDYFRDSESPRLDSESPRFNAQVYSYWYKILKKKGVKIIRQNRNNNNYR